MINLSSSLSSTCARYLERFTLQDFQDVVLFADVLDTMHHDGFGLNDAIEAGLVKTPRVVVRDDGNVDKDLRSRLYHIYMDETVKDDINQKVDESTPLPEMVKALLNVLPLRSIAAPLATVVAAVPKGPLVTEPVLDTPSLTIPADTVVPLEYVLAPDSVNVPAPCLVSAPEPEMIPVIAPLVPVTSVLRL
jgi:hypothetical protein